MPKCSVTPKVFLGILTLIFWVCIDVLSKCACLIPFMSHSQRSKIQRSNHKAVRSPAFRRNGKGNVFTGVCPFIPAGGGVAILPNGGTPSFQTGGVSPSQVRKAGVPLNWMGVTPPLPTHRDSSIASTCYAAGGMPLAFTQEDFLVFLSLYL